MDNKYINEINSKESSERQSVRDNEEAIKKIVETYSKDDHIEECSMCGTRHLRGTMCHKCF